MARIFDVIEFMDDTGREIVHRVPEQGAGDFRIGSQLIVRESQAAVFFRDGKALDTFGPGRHTLTTANIPLLIDLIGGAFGGQSPFKAEVFYVNLREFVDMKWGTAEPLAMRDQELGMVRLRGFGTYSMQVWDPQLFVTKISGTQGLYTTSEVENFLRSIIVSNLTDLLGETQRSLFDLPSVYEELGAGTKARAQDDFNSLGLDLKLLLVANISTTEETAKVIDEKAAMGAVGNMQAYLQFKTAQAIARAAEGGGGGEAGSLAGLGAGLGAGVGIGTAMAQAMAEAMRSGQPQEPPAAKMTKAQIQEMLDALDVSLAQGKISEATYNSLKAKWEQKLKDAGQ
ncbi:MAG: SPFH domain-containing protein [Chloroflexi bacterium]|nr:SPFH domain-containing protein [Chloroflexota bacterium]